MAFLDEFGSLVGEEAAETAMHDVIVRAMSRSANNNGSGKEIAKAGIMSVFTDSNKIMQMARGVVGFIPAIAYPVIMTTIAAAMKNSKFLDRILPDDNRAGVKEAKFLLRNIAPHLVIGVGEGLRDYASVNERVEEVMDKHRSDVATTPDVAQNKALDLVVVTELIQNRVFIMARDSDGNIKMGADGVPVVNDPEWVLARNLWKQTHKPSKKKVPQGNKQPPKEVDVPADPFPYEIITIQDALDRGALMSSVDATAIRAMLRKPRSWGETLSSEVLDVLLALSVTRSLKPILEQGLAEDYFKDLPGKCDVALLEHMSENFHGRIRSDGTFSDNDFDAVVAFMDDFLGAELTLWSRIKRAAARMWRNRGVVGGRTKVGLYTVAALVVLAILNMIGLFCYSLVVVICGFIVNLADSLTVFGYTFKDPAIPAGCMLLVGSLTIFVLLHFLHPVQDFINAVTFWVPKSNKDSLIRFKQRFGYMFVVPVTTGLGLALFHASGISRLVVVGLALLSVLKMEGYKSYDAPHTARWTGIKNVATGSVLILTVYFIDWLLRVIPWSTIIMASVPFFQNAHLSMLARAIVSILAGVVALTLGCLFILFLGKIMQKREMSKFWYVMVFAIACVMGYLAWDGFASEEQNTVSSSGASTGSTMPVQAVEVPAGASTAQVRQDINPPIIRTSLRMMRGRPNPVETSRKRGGHLGHTHTRGLDCSKLAFYDQQVAGCR